MFSIPDFLDRAKRGAGVESDYGLAKALGVNRANVSGWRNEKFAPDERAIVLLCKYSGDDPEHVAACIQSMRAANDDAADLWRRVAERLKGTAGAVFVWTLLAIVLAEYTSTPAYAASAAGGGLYIMSNAFRRWLQRVGWLMLSPHNPRRTV